MNENADRRVSPPASAASIRDRVNRRKMAIRGLGFFLLVFGLVCLVFGGILLSRMFKASDDEWALVPIDTKIGVWFSLAQTVGLLVGSVGLVLVRGWGMVLTIGVMASEIAFRLLEFALERDARSLLSQLIPLTIIVFLVCVRSEFRRAQGGTADGR